MKKALLLGSVLLLVGVIVGRGITRGEFDYNVDESQHAATGLYVASILKDAPAHPVAYTYRYYAQYPALSGVIHWPPLFYGFEGAMFLVVGPTVVAARLTILLFALLGCVFWFLLVAELLNDWAAAFSTLIVALLPAVLLFEKTVMLEIPCLALCLAALYYWYRYLTAERLLDLYLFAVFCSAALLTKQNSIFVPVVCAVTLTALGKWSLVLNRRALGPLAIVVALVVPFYTLVYLVHWKTIAMDLEGQGAVADGSTGPSHFLGTVFFYLKALPEQLGWPLLVLAVIGVATCAVWAKRDQRIFMLAWIVSCYAVFTLISHKEARYSFYWIPPLTFFIAGPLAAKWKPRAAQVLAAGLALVLLVQAVRVGSNYQRPYIAGYESVATRIKQLNRPGVIMFEAPLAANFIFFLRRVDSDRQFVVLRKLLRVVRIKMSGGWEDLATTVDQVRAVIDTNGVRYVIVSDVPAGFEGEKNLQALLQSEPRFKLLGTFPITGNERQWQGRHLYLYENTQCVPPVGGLLRIPMLTLGHDVVVPWDELGPNPKSTP